MWPRSQVEQAAALVKAGKVKVEVAQVPQKLYVDVTVKGEGHTGRAVVRDLHTNVVLVQQDGETTLDKTNAAAQSPDGRDLVPPEEIAAFLTVKSIWDYCTEELDPLHDPIDIIRSAVKVNTAISEEGLSKEYGLAIGRNLELNCRKGLMTRDLTTNAMIIASAGADAGWRVPRSRWWQTPAAATRALRLPCLLWQRPAGWTSTKKRCCGLSLSPISSPSGSNRNLAA